MSDEDKKPKKQAIDAPRGTHYMVYPEELTIIGLDTPDDEKHPLYDPRILRPLKDEEVANVDYFGVLTPVEAKKDGERLIVTDGRGRVRKARAANIRRKARGDELMRVPVMLARGTDVDLFARSRVKNLHDADGPMTNARNAQRLIDAGKTLVEVALSFGVTEQTIRNWQAMLDLAPEVIKATIANEISNTAAIQLATMSQADQVATLAEIKEETKQTGEKPTVERVKRKVAEKAGKAMGKTPKEKIESARTVLLKLALTKSATKEDLQGALERVCRILTGHGLEKLAAEEE